MGANLRVCYECEREFETQLPAAVFTIGAERWWLCFDCARDGLPTDWAWIRDRPMILVELREPEVRHKGDSTVTRQCGPALGADLDQLPAPSAEDQMDDSDLKDAFVGQLRAKHGTRQALKAEDDQAGEALLNDVHAGRILSNSSRAMRARRLM